MIDEFDGQHKFLSNFSPSAIQFRGVDYPTVEHAFQAAKSEDPSIRRAIAELTTPGLSKKAGRKVELRRDWDRIKLSVMDKLLRLKFAIPELQQQLMATGDEVLVEGNWWGDKYWGVSDGGGLNHLGILLMKIRRDIQNGDFKKDEDE